MIFFYLFLFSIFSFSNQNELIDEKNQIFPKLSESNQIKQFAGLLPVEINSNKKSKLFYWLVVKLKKNSSEIEKLPLVIDMKNKLLLFIYLFI